MRAAFWIAGVLGMMRVAVAASAAEGPELRTMTVPDDVDVRIAGAMTVETVCRGCHDLKYLNYESYVELGMSPERVDALRGEAPLWTPLMSRMPTEARLATFGRLPPDLSLITRAREGGAAYVYTLLTSFEQQPDGRIDNRLFPGIKMPDILGYASTAHDPEGRDELALKAQQVARFLEWAADPHADERHRLGFFVLLYLGVLSGLLYRIKKRVWARLDGG